MDNNVPAESLTNLLNPEFTFSFAGKDYQVKKANIKQAQQYQIKLSEINESDKPQGVKDLSLLSYAVFLILNKADSTITEEFVEDNLRGDVDGVSLLTELGFINPQKAKILQQIQAKVLSENSSPSSLTEQAGQ